MDQQDQGAADSRESTPNSQMQGDQPRPSSRDADSTWGIGSASALDSLRRQNFRGKRQESKDGKPSSD